METASVSPKKLNNGKSMKFWAEVHEKEVNLETYTDESELDETSCEFYSEVLKQNGKDYPSASVFFVSNIIYIIPLNNNRNYVLFWKKPTESYLNI